jgi:hypothetical protein
MNFLRWLSCLAVLLCSMYGIANDEPMRLNIKKEVPIYNKWNEFKKRMVWIPKHAEFVRHSSDLQPASDEAYKIMVDYQEQLKTTDRICIILNDPNAIVARSGFGAHPLGGKFHEIHINPLLFQGSQLKVGLGHEAVHGTGNLDQQVKTLQRDHHYYRTKAFFGLGSFAISAGLTIIGLCTGTHPSLLSIFGGFTSAGGAFYAYNRVQAAKTSSQLHTIELHCDTVAVSLGKTPEEKIELAEAGKKLLTSSAAAYDSANTESVKNRIDQILFSQDHPRDSVRIANFQSIIDGIRKESRPLVKVSD